MDWEVFARPWIENAAFFEGALRPVQNALMDAAELTAGERVLDVGFGTGPTLRQAHVALGSKGQLTGIDIAPPFVAHARTRVPEDVTLLTGDAQTYAFYPAQFDVVISNFGIMFFGDTPAALRNLRQATRPGGRFIATVWGPAADNPWFSMPRQVVTSHVPGIPKPDPAAPGPMRFAKPAGFLADLTAAGWTPELTTVDLMLTPPGTVSDTTQMLMDVTVPMMLAEIDVDSATLDAISKDIKAALTDMQRAAGAHHVPAKIHVITAEA